MSQDLVTTDCFDTALQDLAKTKRLCQELMKLPHYAKLGEVGIFAVSEKAKQIGMHPLEALNGGMYFVNGKVEMQGQAMLAMIRKNGHSVTLDPKSTNTHVIMHGKRADNGDTWTVTFGIDDAKKAGIYKNVWEKYPQTMCVWRCVSMLSRFLFSDILKGCYVVGEISEAPVMDAPINLDNDVVVVESKPEVQRVSGEQAADLHMLIELCEPSFAKSVWEFYKKQGILSFDELPLQAFAPLHHDLTKASLEFQQTLRKP